MDIGAVKKVLIIKPSSLGDVIHALPVAVALKAALPSVTVDWVVNRGYEGVLTTHPAIDRVITFDRRLLKGGGRLGRLSAFVNDLRRERYDAVIDLQGLLRSGLMTLICRSPKKVGFENAREGASLFYTDKVPVPDNNIHAVDRYLLTLGRLGISYKTVSFGLTVGPGDSRLADEIIKAAGIGAGEPFVVIAPSARWDTKRWPAGNFVRLANRLKGEKGVRAVFIGSAEDADILNKAGEKLVQVNAAAFGKTTIMSLAALLTRARLLVTNDSGPMHIAAAVGTPAVALFGPTDPARTGPYGEMHSIIRAADDCSPCFKRECPEVRCMSGITVGRVFDAAVDILERKH